MTGDPHIDSGELAELGGESVDPVERLQARKRAHAALFGDSLTSGRPIQVDRYELLSKAGSGGLGTVWKAYDPKLDRELAIKLLRSDKLRTGQRARRQLMAEAAVMARLAHPNVVRVYDLGEAEVDLGLSLTGASSGQMVSQLYVAMEFVDGCTLRQWQQQGERDLAELLAVYGQAAAGLIAAHEAKLVHGDFKPDNVLIDRRGRVLVTDFAVTRNLVREQVELELSTLESPTESERNKLRQSVAAVLIGTPAYMAPEQLDGEVPDARSDQFGFCVALWEALTGDRPFVGRTFAALRESIAAGPPPFPADVRPARLRTVLARGLAEDPSDRYPDLRTLLTELEQVAGPARARRVWIGVALAAGLLATIGLAAAQLREPAPSEQPPAAAATALPSCATTAQEAGASVWTPDQVAALRANWGASSELGEVETQLADWRTRWLGAAEAACEAARASGEAGRPSPALPCLDRQLERFDVVVGVLANADGDARPHARELLRSLPRLDACDDPRAAERIIDEPPDEPDQRAALADARRSLARAEYLLLLREYDDALSLIDPVARLCESLGWDAGLARALLVRGLARDALGQLDAGSDDLSEAMLAARRAGRPDIEAQPLIELALVAIDQADHEAARRWLELAAIAVIVEAEDERHRVSLALARGLLAVAEGDDASARVEFARALRLAKLDEPGLSGPNPSEDQGSIRPMLERLRDAEALPPSARRRVDELLVDHDVAAQQDPPAVAGDRRPAE